MAYKDVKWNAAKGTTSSAKEGDSKEMVQEDVWQLGDKWKDIRTNLTDPNRPETNGLDKKKVSETTSTT